MIDAPGIYELTAEEYHADPCPEPSLSSSLANTLVNVSPLHCWTQHPKLNPRFRRTSDDKYDLGNACHSYVLEGSEAFALIEADDFRTKAAKEARDAARAMGRIPLLAYRMPEIRRMAEALNEQLDRFRDKPRPLSNGKPERTVIWREGDTWCRARPDWLHDDFWFCDDLKSTEASANPSSWPRTMYGMGADLQAAWYSRGIKAVTGVEPAFRFVVVESSPPYAASVIALGPAALVLAQKKVLLALELWAKCRERDEWPAFPTRTAYVDLPAYEESRWIERELREVA